MRRGGGEAGPGGAALPALEVGGCRQQAVQQQPQHHHGTQHARETREEALDEHVGTRVSRWFALHWRCNTSTGVSFVPSTSGNLVERCDLVQRLSRLLLHKLGQAFYDLFTLSHTVYFKTLKQVYYTYFQISLIIMD